MFASLTAQKLAHDIDALNAFYSSDVPEGVDVNLFEDAKRVLSLRVGNRVSRALNVSAHDASVLLDSAEYFRRDLIATRYDRAQKRRAAREEREAALAQA